jgi:hypothetical protein
MHISKHWSKIVYHKGEFDAKQQFNPAYAFYAKLFSQHNFPQYIFFTHTDKGENELVDYAVDMMQSMACLQMPVIVASGP